MSGLHTLLELQEHDLHIDQLRHRRDSLAEKAELADLQKQRAALDGRRNEIATQRDEVVGRQTKAEDEVASTETRIAEIDKRMVSGAVTASRDLQAMQAEIDSLRARVSALEDTVLEAMDEREPLDADVARLENEVAEIDARVTTLQAAIAQAEAEIDSEIAAEQEKRRSVATAVPDELAATYERLRSRLGGIGAAKLDGNRCSGCHLTLSATEFDRIKHQDPETLVYCEQCGRILVRVA